MVRHTPVAAAVWALCALWQGSAAHAQVQSTPAQAPPAEQASPAEPADAAMQRLVLVGVVVLRLPLKSGVLNPC